MHPNCINDIRKICSLFKIKDESNFINEISSPDRWTAISYISTLSEEFIKEFADKVNWDLILTINHNLSEEFIREIIGSKYYLKINPIALRSVWTRFSTNPRMSENFLRDFADKVNWGWVGVYQKLSEDFIREFAHKVNWYVMSYQQTLSEEFIREFIDKIDFESLAQNENLELSEAFYMEFEDKLKV